MLEPVAEITYKHTGNGAYELDTTSCENAPTGLVTRLLDYVRTSPTQNYVLNVRAWVHSLLDGKYECEIIGPVERYSAKFRIYERN
nr:MAG TPA: hypothetical protein [Caudoviricetes sp.]